MKRQLEACSTTLRNIIDLVELTLADGDLPATAVDRLTSIRDLASGRIERAEVVVLANPLPLLPSGSAVRSAQ